MTDIFLSYASEDRRRVQQLYRKIRNAGLACWMDKPPYQWQQEGIQPGEDWDTVIRQRLSEANVILVLLSQSSVEKRGYVQKEFRLALQVAAERPPNAIALIPVLLEECSPPPLRVDTISFGQFQWYELYRYGIQKLVQYLCTVLGQPAPASTGRLVRRIRPRSGQQASALMMFLSSFRAIENANWRYRPHELFKNALSFVEIGDFAAARDHMRGVVIHDRHQAIRSLRGITDRDSATLAAMMLVGALEYQQIEDSTRRALRRLIPHSVPEVELLAAVLLTRRSKNKSRLHDLVSRYAASHERLDGFHDYLRWHVYVDSLTHLTSTHPRFVWEMVANNPQFPMKGMRFMPMMEETKGLAAFASSDSWEMREIGVSVRAADTSVALKDKLVFLTDEEPRVRFRALEGILMDWHVEDLQPIVDTLMRQPVAHKDHRSWSVKHVSRRPPLCVAHLDDSEVFPPLPVSYRFGRPGLWLGAECADVARCQLTGIVVIAPKGSETPGDDDEFESLIVTRARRNADHWIYEVLAHRST